jgi:hypothetical protein
MYIMYRPEPIFLNVYGAQESIPRKELRQPMYPELVFVDLLRSPGINSQQGGPVRQLYLSFWPARLHRLAESVLRNRFPGSINVYKYGLWRAGTITLFLFGS